MNTQEKALLFTPGVVGLVVGLGWFALDPKGDARQHLLDRWVRALDCFRDTASDLSVNRRRAP